GLNAIMTSLPAAASNSDCRRRSHPDCRATEVATTDCNSRAPGLRRWFRVRRGLLSTCASVSFEYSQHMAKWQDVAMAIERRRVQARGAASVKKQGIGAIQPITE